LSGVWWGGQGLLRLPVPLRGEGPSRLRGL